MKKFTLKRGRWGVFVIVLCGVFGTPGRVFGLEESTGSGGSNAIAVHQLGQTGQDVNIGLILYRNVQTTHEAFFDKDSNGNPVGSTHAFNLDFSGDGNSAFWHDTQLAGIIASRGGVANPNDIGVAPGANLFCARVIDNNNSASWAEFNNAIRTLITTYNCRVIVTGFEVTGITPDGDSDWTMLYDYYASQYNTVFANPAGNENTYVAIFGDAYNGITTGGLRLTDPTNQFDYRWAGLISGSGPTNDGRRKPDIAAPSQSQTVPTTGSDTAWTTTGSSNGETSWSVPHAAGAAALLTGLANQTPGPNDNNSVVIKAVLVNSAMPNVKNKAGVSTNPADSNNTWQADRGYGRLDCLRAYQTLDTSEAEPNTLISQARGWGYGRLIQGQSNVYTINITSRCRLIATLAWHRRIQWTDNSPSNGVIDPGELSGFLANLDMKVFAPNEPNAIFSKALFGYDPSDNLVKCDLLILTPGNYTIRLENNSTNGESANYGFAFDKHPILPGDIYPDGTGIDYVVDINDLSALMQDWLLQDSDYDQLLSPNGIIDFADFAVLAEVWLQIDPLYHQF
ncbi:MAG: S8/S53 family peptidase [Sedimentisphaerales bacterium]